MEGKNVPQRFSRPVMALIAATVAVFSVCLVALPASAVPAAPQAGSAPSAATARASEWWLKALHVTTAWLASQGSGVTVAVLSDGVDSSQPDLRGVVTSAPAIKGAPQASGAFFGQQGTGIASLIAGRGHGQGNGKGIIGIAPAAKILSVPVTLPADDPMLSNASVAGAIPDAIANGITYAVQHGAKVIDLPIDPAQPNASGTAANKAAAGGSTAEHAAVNNALAHNVVLVAPAGDDETAGDAEGFPAAYPGVIAVGAFNSKFIKAPFSTHNSYVTVTAPGTGVSAAANTGNYQVMNSTSAASAVVSGIVALIRSRFPGLSVNQVRRALIKGTVFRPHGGRLDGSGYGTADAGGALAAATLIATGSGHRAGTGAKPLTAPATLPTASSGSLEPRIVRSAAISGGVLVVLLLLILWYALTGRRQTRQKAAAAAQWSERPGQSRYPQVQPNADPMAGYLASPAPPAIMGPDTFGMPPPDWDPDSRVQPALGSASRAAIRRPVVQGAPPWEPASPPGGDSPWSAASAAAAQPFGAPWSATSAPLAGELPRSGSAASAQPRGGEPPWAASTAPRPAAGPVPVQPPLGGRPGSAALPPGSGSSAPPSFSSAVGNSGPDAVPDSEPRIASSGLPRRPRPSTLAPWDAANVPEGNNSGWSDSASQPSAVDRLGAGDRLGAIDRPRLADRPWLLGGSAADRGGPSADRGGPSADRGGPSADRGGSSDGSGLANGGSWPGTGAPGATGSQPNPGMTDWNPAPADGSRPRVTAAGLPVRQPRASSSAPLSPSGSSPSGSSPSGSLWERAVGKHAGQSGASPGGQEPGYSQGGSYDPADSPIGDAPAEREPRRRPIYVWRPAASTDGYQRPPSE